MGSLILGPTETADPLGPLTDRVHALEARQQAIEPRPLFVGLAPGVALYAVPGIWVVGVTSGTFTPVYRAVIPRVPHPAVLVRFGFATGVGMTGEARATVSGPAGSATSSVLTISSNYSSVDALGWQHGLALWTGGGDTTIDVEVRRTGGADPVFAYYGIICMIDPRGCTTGGGTWYVGGWLPNW